MTGLALMLYYVPHPDAAYRSMKDLQFAVTFGIFLRNAHRWAAHAMVAVVFLHMCRVFFTGSYKPPREFNWVVGVLLLLLTLALSFTGYLLPWDQLAFWAITVGTAIVAYFPVLGPQARYLLLGGHEIGPAALLRFYVLHCLILPLAMLPRGRCTSGACARTGGLSAAARSAPPPACPPGRTSCSASCSSSSLVAGRRPRGRAPVDAPLEEIADPTRTPNPAKAPWYFLGLQELVHYWAFFGGVVVPTADRPGPARPALRRHAPARRRRVVRAGAAGGERPVRGDRPCRWWRSRSSGTFFRGPNWAWVWPW